MAISVRAIPTKSYSEFKEQIPTRFRITKGPEKGTHVEEFRQVVGATAKRFRSSKFMWTKGDSEYRNTRWLEWMSEIDFGDTDADKEAWEIIRKIDDSTISELEKDQKNIEFYTAIYYRLHSILTDTSFSDDIDALVFSGPLRKLGDPVFVAAKDDHLDPVGAAKNPSVQQRFVRLGPITIAPSFEVAAIPLSLQEPETLELLPDGVPGVFKALDWRSRLTSLHGRQVEYDQLLSWALDTTTTTPKLMLVSGPGGSGKTRLVADVVSKLVGKHGWSGGFLPNGITNGDIVDGSGEGVALIIDYPEERFDLVRNLLASIANNTLCSRQVRIILVSRENLDAWQRNTNKLNLRGVEEVELGGRSYLEMEDAIEIASDVAETLPDKLGKTKVEFSGVREWLDRHPSHRLPLITLAASVHAVLEPKDGFSLSGDMVLTALARSEQQRVRNYSARDLGDIGILEKLLALSLLTENGLSKDAVFSLGESRTGFGKSGAILLEAVQKTPFWRSKTEHRASHLMRLEPDRLGAAFLNLAFELNDPSPALPRWIEGAVADNLTNFEFILGRIAFDLGYINVDASRAIEEAAISMLDQSPGLLNALHRLSSQRPPVFSTELSISVCQKLLSATLQFEAQLPLRNNLSIMLASLGKYEESLYYAKEAVTGFRILAEAQPDEYLTEFGAALNTLVNRLLALGKFDDAVEPAQEQVGLYQKLTVEKADVFTSDYIISLNSLANVFFGLGRYEEALGCSTEAMKQYSDMGEASANAILPDPSALLNTFVTMLSSAGHREDALMWAENAVASCRILAEENPAVSLPDLAISLKTLADTLHGMERHGEAIQNAQEAVAINRQLIAVRRKPFLPDLGRSLNCLAVSLSALGEHEEALDVAFETMRVFDELSEEHPDAFALNRVVSLTNLVKVLTALNEHERAQPHLEDIVEMYQRLSLSQPERFLPDLALALKKLVASLEHLKRDAEAIGPAEDLILVYGKLAEPHFEIFQPQLALALNNASSRLSKCEQPENALCKAEEAVRIYRELANEQPKKFNAPLALSLNNLANRLSEMGRKVDAVSHAEDSVKILLPFFLARPKLYVAPFGHLVAFYKNLCAEIAVSPDEKLLAAVPAPWSHVGKLD